MEQMSRHRLTNVGAVNEAEEIEKSHGWDDEEVNLEPQLALSYGIICDEGLAISSTQCIFISNRSKYTTHVNPNWIFKMQELVVLTCL